MSLVLALPVLGLGLLAGGQHAIGGPDHFAGVAPCAVRAGARAYRVGVAWGLGHASGAGAAAVIALLLRALIPGVEEHLSGISDAIVGVLMCLVGALGLRAAVRASVHDHTHHHAGDAARARQPGVLAHRHAHLRPFALPWRRTVHDHEHGHSAFVLGLFHGAGGLAHLFAVVPALGLPGVALPALYLCGYGLGSLTLITAFAAGVGRLAPASRPRAQRRLLIVASSLSLAVGLVWIVHPF